jgi:phosphate transport system permease protein
MDNKHLHSLELAYRPLELKKKLRLGETVIQTLLFLAGFLSIFITLAIVYELGKEAWLFFGDPDVTFAKFFGTTEWSPGMGSSGSGRW